MKRDRVFWLCKGRYMNHDVIADRYARLFEFPNCASNRVNLVALCIDYRLSRGPAVPADLEQIWNRINIPRTLFIGWVLQFTALLSKVRPDYVIASSDCLCVLIGYLAARSTGARFIADLYDDYSTFGLARIPGIRPLYRRALAAADGLVAVSQTLAADLKRDYPGTPVLVLESTIDSKVFYPRDRGESMGALSLEHLADKQLVAACGGLNHYHGANIVFDAFRHIMAERPDVHFAIAGRATDECPLPEGDNVHYLGILPHDQMPLFFSAMDVVVVPLSNTRFGYYAFPQKAYEVVACRTPVAAADVGALAMLFESLPRALYDPGSPDDLARVILEQLSNPACLDVDIPTWQQQSERLLAFIQGISAETSSESPAKRENTS